MLEAPRQDWKLYENLCRKACVERLRDLTPAAALGIYDDLYRFASTLAMTMQERESRETTRWHEKVARRKEQRAAFVALDRLRDPRDG